MQYYLVPRAPRPRRRLPSWRQLLAPKVHEKRYAKTHRQKGTSVGTLLATPATKDEYRRELGFQNDSRMEPKMEPRQQRPILTKHAQACTDCMSTPPWGAPCSLIFRDRKKSPKSQHNHSDLRTWLQNNPQSAPPGSPKGDPNPAKILTKSSLSRRGLPPATSDLPEGGAP